MEEYTTLGTPLGTPPGLYASLTHLFVGSPPPVHAVYTLRAGSVLVDGLLGCALLAGGPQVVGRGMLDPQKGVKPAETSRKGELPPV